MPKNSLTHIILAGTLFLGSLSVAIPPSAQTSQYETSTIERVVDVRRPKLEVNTSNLERNIVSKCEEDGVKDILELMVTSRYEEFWAYLPQKCEWVELGYKETAGKPDEVVVRVQNNHLKKLMAENKDIVLYHFHPGIYFNQNPSKDIEIERNLRLSLPSVDDILAAFEVSWDFYDLQKNGTIRNKVVTPYGITEYIMKDAGKGQRHNSMYRDNIPIAKTALQLSFIINEKTREFIPLFKEDPIKAVAEFSKVYSNEYISVNFTPHANREVIMQNRRVIMQYMQ